MFYFHGKCQMIIAINLHLFNPQICFTCYFNHAELVDFRTFSFYAKMGNIKMTIKLK